MSKVNVDVGGGLDLIISVMNRMSQMTQINLVEFKRRSSVVFTEYHSRSRSVWNLLYRYFFENFKIPIEEEARVTLIGFDSS